MNAYYTLHLDKNLWLLTLQSSWQVKPLLKELEALAVAAKTSMASVVQRWLVSPLQVSSWRRVGL